MQLRQAWILHPDGDELPCMLAGNCLIPLGDIIVDQHFNFSRFKAEWNLRAWPVLPLIGKPKELRLKYGKLVNFEGVVLGKTFDIDTGKIKDSFWITSV